MKHSKKYLKVLKKRLLACMSSIAVCLVLIAGSKLAGLSMPISIKNILPTKSNADETKIINNANSEEDSVGASSARPTKASSVSVADIESIQLNIRNEYIKIGQELQLQALGTVGEDLVSVRK